MNQRETEKAIEVEVAHWPGATVAFEPGGKHPKAKLEFGGLIIRQAFPGTPGTSTSILKTLADMRRALRKMDAKRDTEATEADDQAVAERLYQKPNPGRDMRPDPAQGEPGPVKASIGDKLIRAGLASSSEVDAAQDPDSGISIIPLPSRAEERAKQESAWQAAADAIVDGIYFDLDEEIYHRVKRLSTSGITRICVSPATFWEESWLNPSPRRLNEKQQERKDAARIVGRAYHCARLESASFEKRFCGKPDRADFEKIEGFLGNGTEIGEALAEYGEPKKRAKETVVEQARRLEQCGYEGPLWPLIEAEFEEQLEGRVALSAVDWANIQIDMERLRANEDVAQLLSGGAAEVSIFWTDRNGIQMKCRVDYLQAAWWSEFKTFDNSRGKTLRQAINDAMRFNRYYIGAVNYRDGIEAVRVGGLHIIGNASNEERDLIAEIQLRPGDLECWYVFQEKSGVPNILARRFNFFAVPHNMKLWTPGATAAQIAAAEAMTRTKTGLHIRGLRDIDEAKRAFVLYSQVYPPGVPWAPIEAMGEFDDMDFNRSWLEGQYD